MIKKTNAIIIVLYYAQISDSFLNQCPKNSILIFVDNTPERDLGITSQCVYIPLKENRGIAVAQNIGLCKAEELGCQFVLFFDQDSKISASYIEQIAEEYQRISKRHNNLFLLGPRVFDERENKEYKSIFHSYSSNEEFEVRPMIISSGSYTSLTRVKEVGYLDESLFIDLVDYEWCWRANSLGLISGITNRVSLQHNVGQKWLKIGRYIIIISSPFRYYYQYRNYLWLCIRKYVPIQWKINTGIKLFLRMLYFPFILKDWIPIERNILHGIKDGILLKNTMRL